MLQLTQGRSGLALWAALILALVCLASFAWIQLGFIGRDAAEDRYADDARALAHTIGSIHSVSDPDAANRAIGALERFAAATGLYASLHDADGNIIHATAPDSDPAREAGAPEVIDALQPPGEGVAQRLNPAYGVESVYFAHGLPDGSGVVRIAVPVSELSGAGAQYRRLFLFVSMTGAALVLLLLLLVTRRASGPLRHLSGALRQGRIIDAVSLGSTNADMREVSHHIARMSQEGRDIASAAETQRSRLASILDSLAVGVIVLDVDERVLMTNVAAAQFFGFGQPTADGVTLIELVRDHEAAAIAREALLTALTATAEITPAGEPGRAMRLVASPYTEGEESRVLLAAYDVSEEHRAQRLRHEFLANASHEIRTPLAGIQATLETLDLGAIEDPQAARPFVSSALGEVQRLTTFVESLLDLSRMEMGWAPLSPQRLRVGEVIDRCVHVMSALASRAQIELVVDVSRGVPEISADPDRLHQALVNLVHNAIKFTPAGGRVAVSAESRDDAVWLRVTDTGIGIPADDVPVLMDRMLQGDVGGRHGAGLGLAIVQQIIDAHHGEVHVESQVGSGSTFSIRLPLTEHA